MGYRARQVRREHERAAAREEARSWAGFRSCRFAKQNDRLIVVVHAHDEPTVELRFPHAGLTMFERLRAFSQAATAATTNPTPEVNPCSTAC